jgi:hypothetical protein
MRYAFVAALSALLLVQSAPIAAQTNADRLRACAAEWNALKTAGRTNGQSYQAFCKSYLSSPSAGPIQPRPSTRRTPNAGGPPPGSTARCHDGTFTSVIKGRSGACSGHGGVETWL